MSRECKHCGGLDFVGHKCPEDNAVSKSASVTGHTLSDYDRWFLPCSRCGYDTGKLSERSEARCWKCGNFIQRDYSERALKKIS